MSYGFYRLGSNVAGKVLPIIGFDGSLTFAVTAPPAREPKTVPPTITEMSAEPVVMTTMAARAQGYTGDQCSHCNSMRMKMAGHCMVCDDCGTTTGCS